MALSLQDGTKQETLDILSGLVGVPIKYARIFSRYVTRDNYPAGAFSCMLACYVQDNPAPEQSTPLHYELGVAPLPQSAIEAMTAADDRSVLYKYLEWVLHFRALQGVEDTQSANVALEALATDLGIEYPFGL